MGIETHIIHNASIMNAAGACGLQLYSFGYTISIPFFTPKYKPDSFYDRIVNNRKHGMHTLCLLDIKVREPDYDRLVKTGRTVYLPPRFMTVKQAVQQLLEVEDKKKAGGENAWAWEEGLCYCLCIACFTPPAFLCIQ